MNATQSPTTDFSEFFDSETLALLTEAEVELPGFGDIDLDVAFGVPLEMYEAGYLPHERLTGLDLTAAIEAIEARENRMLAARDISATDPTATELARERLIDVLLPYAAQQRITQPATAVPVPLAA